MRKKYSAAILRMGLLIALLAGMILQPQFSVQAAAILTIEPLTWNVIGLDSNNVNVGPNHFPVGARVCNTGDTPATNVNAIFVWDSANALIDLRPGTLTSLSVASLANGGCMDFYFEVEVTRNASAYDTTRNYHIAVTADGGLSVSTPTPRVLYVEHLVSQNRNAVTDVQYGTSLATLSSVASGGTMSLMVGNTYFIRLIGFTATQGYEQLESFINIPNTIFQINSVSTTYTANSTSGRIPNTNDRAYGDACVWENNPNSPNYRSCLMTGKVGGDITVTYSVTILEAPSAPLVNPQPLSTLIYDFSGSSFHYNADYGVSTRYAFVLDPSTLTISKNFSPDPTNAGGISTLTFTLTNPNSASVSGLNFTDTLPTTPGAMTVANPTSASTSGCGSPTFAPVAGAGSISFSNGTIAANSTCTIKLNVTVPVIGTYTNTSSHLFIDSLDTGNFATDPLTVNNAPPAPAPVCGLTMAQWTFAGFTTNPPPFPAPDTQAGNVTTAAISVGNGLTANADTTTSGGNPQPGIRTYGWQNAGPINTATSAYIQFAIDTSQYSQIALQFDAQRKANGPNNDELYYSTNGTTWTLKSTFNSTTSWATYGPYDFTGQTNTSGITYFRIYGYGANATSSGNDFNLDNVTFTGCATPVPSSITKAFSPNPIAISGISTLTFTLANSNSIVLTGVNFTDSLPSGIQVAATPTASTTCGGTPTWAPTAGTTTLTFGSPTAASIPANSSCTVSVNVTGTVDGSHQNVSGFISSTNGGTNTSSTGSASATLTVLKPPAIAKLFAPNPILANGTSTLTFTISNPNLNNDLTGVAFLDTYPTGVTNTNPLSTSNSCGGTLTSAAGGNSVSLSGGTVSAGGSCTVTTTVTAFSVGTYINTSGVVSSTNGGTGNTASDILNVNVPSPAIALLKQVSTSAAGPLTNFIGVTAGSDVYYQFTVENTGDVPLTSVNVTDPDLNVAGCTWVDGDGDSLTAPYTLSVAEAADNDHIAVCVLGPISAVSGSNLNTATATSTYNSTDYTDTSTAIYATTELALDKTVTETSFDLVGDELNYSYLVTNSGFAPLLGPVTVTDDKATVTCPAVSTAVQTAPAGPGDGDNYLDAGEQIACTAVYTITLADFIAGSVTNTASATADSVASNTDSETIYRAIADFSVTKTNNVTGNVAAGNSFAWTITVDNTGLAAGIFGLGNEILSDTLPGVPGYYPQGALTVTDGGIAPVGTINCSITGIDLSCVASTIVTMPVGASFSVTFTVTPTIAGDLANTGTVDPDGNVIELNESNNTATDTVTVIAPPSIEKQFIPEAIAVGDASTLTFTIFNTNTSIGLTGVSFTDSLPAGLQVANPPNASTSGCGTPTFNPVTGDAIISFSDALIPETGSCSVNVDVIATTSGVKNNTTSNVTSTNGGTGNTSSYTLTVFDAQPSKSIVTTSESFTGVVTTTERVAIGEMVRYRLATTIPEGSFTNVQLLDGLPTGLQFLDDDTATVAFVCNGGAACMTSSALAGAGLVVNGSTSSVSPTFVLPGSAISGGPFGSGTDVTFSLGDITNSDVDGDSEYAIVEFNALVLNVNSSATINQGVDNLTGASNTNNRQNDATLLVDGSTVGSASPNVTVAIAEPAITSITKTVAPAAGPYLPGDSLTYTLSFSNNATGNNAAPAFDVVLTDTFDSNLTLGAVNVSSTQGTSGVDTCAGGTAFVTSDSTVVQMVTVDVSCLDPGNSVTVTIDAAISGAVLSGTTIANSSALTYTSLPGTQGNCSTSPFTCTGVGGSGSGTGERDGSGGSGADDTILNNYAVTSNTVNTDVGFGSITIIKDTVPDDAQDFGFSGTGPNNYDFGFDLDDDADGTLPNSQTLSSLAPGSYTATEATVGGWSLTGLTCADPDSGSTTDLGTATATIDLDAGESITCTFTNAPTPAAAMTVVKSSTTTGLTAAGTVTYSYLVTNTGNVALTGISLSDDNDNDDMSCPATTLAVSADMTCTATHTFTQAEMDANGSPTGGSGNLTNNVTASSNEASDATDTLVIPIAQNPAITLTKTGTLNDDDSTPGLSAGDTISYAFIVQNTGNVTLTNITLADTVGGVTISGGPIASLAPGASDNTTFTGSYTLAQTDINAGTFTNTATATGTPPTGPDITDPDSDTQTLTGTPAITLTKTGTLNDDDGTLGLSAGDTISYFFTVQNTGNVTLTNITLADTVGGVTISGGPIASLAPGASDTATFTGTYALTQVDIDAGAFTNTATVTGTPPSGPNVTDPDDDTQTLAGIPAITLTKTGTLNDDDGTPGLSVGDTISYAFTVQNTGNVTLTNITLADIVGGVTISGGPIASLAPGASDTTTFTGTYTLTQANINAGTFTNTATVTGTLPSGPNVTDPDSDTQDFTGALIADPAMSKAGDPNQATVGESVTFTLTVTNQGNAPASNVVITDALPAQFDVTAVNVSGAPFGTSVNVTPPIGTGSAPYTVVVTLGGDLGASDIVTIDIVTTVNGLGNPPISNTANLTTSSNTDLVSNNTDSVTVNIQAPLLNLPATGFAPNVVTNLGNTPPAEYRQTGGVTVEIPSLGISIPIVGVPLKNGNWDVTWLGKQAGWLEGSAFPAWSGNSVLTGHVYDSNGLPGPFVNLSRLKYGDRILIHAYGQKYIFEIRANQVVAPNDTSAFKHEEKPWITLVTCKEYDEKTNTYRKRVVVRAVLVSVVWE